MFLWALTFYKTGNQYPHIQLIVSEATFAQNVVLCLAACKAQAVAEAMFASHIILRVLL